MVITGVARQGGWDPARGLPIIITYTYTDISYFADTILHASQCCPLQIAAPSHWHAQPMFNALGLVEHWRPFHASTVPTFVVLVHG